jgi:hypothetical protein
MVDLLLLKGSDQLLFKLKLHFLYKTTYLNEEVNRTESHPSVRVPCLDLRSIGYVCLFMEATEALLSYSC